MKPAVVSAWILVAASASLAFAQGERQGPKPATAQAAANAQAALPASGGVQQCIACHGAQGEGNPQGGIPRIAGQPAAYLRKQLESYADGSRRNAVMQPIAKGLSREARAAGAAYYAALPPAGNSTANAARPAPNARGEELATIGDERRQVQGCGNCHGPGGIGESPGIPYLAGQGSAYLTAALNEFRSGARRNDAGAQMRALVRGLSPEDIGAVAQYYAALPPPARPAPENVVRAPTGPGPTAGRSAATRASRAEAGPSTQSSSGPGSAVGSEQGAGTSGGAQGAGGIDQSSTNKTEPPKQR